MLVDSHVHLQNKEYDTDRVELINNLKSNDLDFCICVGYDLSSSIQAVVLSKEYNNIYAAVGIHPSDSSIYNETMYNQLLELSSESTVVAIGEIGLDYHYQPFDKQKQKDVFAIQIELAKITKKPFIVHMRDAYADFEKDFLQPVYCGAVMHCYSGDQQQALRYIDKGYYISFSGNVTYKNSQHIRDAAQVVPLDRLLIETDCPYLAPLPHRGKINYPQFVKLVAKEIAIIKNKSEEEIANITNQNARNLFGIKK